MILFKSRKFPAFFVSTNKNRKDIKMNKKEQLIERLKNEFRDYKEALITLPAIQVFNKSYETAIKQEIPYIIGDMEFSNFELEALNKYKGNLLSAFYDEWIDYDLGINEVLEPSVEKATRFIIRDYKNEQNKSSMEL